MKKGLSLDDFDVGTKSNEGVEIELRHPGTSDELGIFITVVGRYSEKYQAAVRSISAESIKGAAAKKKKPDPITTPLRKVFACWLFVQQAGALRQIPLLTFTALTIRIAWTLRLICTRRNLCRG